MQWTVPLERKHLLWTPSLYSLWQTLCHTRPEHVRQSQKGLQSPVKWQKIKENQRKDIKKDHSGMLDKQASQRRVQCDFLKYLYLGCLLITSIFFSRRLLTTLKLVTSSHATGPSPCCLKSDPCRECLPAGFLKIALRMEGMRAWNKFRAKF